MYVHKSITTIATFLLACLSGYTQTGLPHYASTRGMALAGTGVVYQAAEGLFVNPASIADLNNWQANLSSEIRFAQTDLTQFTLAIAGKITSVGNIGINIQQESVLSYTHLKIGLNYALKIHDKIALGTQININRLAIDQYGSSSAPNATIALLANMTKTIRIGFSVINPFPVVFADGQELPTILTLGLHYTLSETVQLITEIEKDIYFDPNIKIALEYNPITTLALRFGLQSFPANYSFGTGWTLSPLLDIDLAIQYHDQLGFSPGLGIRLRAPDK